jgi:sn-glycerol 3-phosphate transport system ATP-binding protein/multiple sugar transport system ATP-binding protein
VLKSGKIEQMGAPLEVYARPKSRFVASFLGSPAMNFLPAKVVGERVRAPGFDAPLVRSANALSMERVVLAGVRPHDVAISRKQNADITMRVEVVEAMGFETYAHGRVGESPFVARLEGEHRVGLGDVLPLDIAEKGLHLFDPESELALS